MRINEDYIDTLSDDEMIDNHLESDEASHKFQYVICFGLKSESNNYAIRLEKILSSFPYINRVSRLETEQDTTIRYGTSLTIHNGTEDFSLETFYEVNFITVGIDADFKGNIRNTCSFLLWLYKLPKERIETIIVFSSFDNFYKPYRLMPQTFNELLDFIEYKSEEFNSADRNPNRVSFAYFI